MTQEQKISADLLKNIKGANEWKKDKFHRIYFDLVDLYGLKLETYNTGNISSATLDGDKISNSKARKILMDLKLGKFWYDVNKNEFESKNLDSDYVEFFTTEITKLATA